MNAQLTLFSTNSLPYISWRPVPCSLALSNIPAGTANVNLLLSNNGPAGGGKVIFSLTENGAYSDTLQLTAGVAPVSFFVAGKYGSPSSNDKDAVILVADAATHAVVGQLELMVRVRKDANKLSDAERDRFVQAFGVLNSSGKFQPFRDMHVQTSLAEAHGNYGFLPWHRAYLLDLERQLQAIIPSVTLPYWKFDSPAPNIFTLAFMGVSGNLGNVQFTDAHPFRTWKTDTDVGIIRTPKFQTATEKASEVVRNDSQTIAISNQFMQFTSMEGDPHGSAHNSFNGSISNPATAPKDPLFYLLHTNVDRLWARWQSQYKRTDLASTATYPFLGAAGTPGSIRIGHNLKDTLWPWNNVHTPPRPNFPPPGNGMPGSPEVPAPGISPRLADMIDYQGKHDARAYLGFDYDNIPYEQ
ncbi:tyrosinase family protein [Mucilaginibacter sp. AW1-7]|uniref:tyrosinase family protein n=1 Tax=Mucilaginibacter sp. AW1-7 TaxID=3349874 RepID=UPI003F739B20